MKRQECSAQGFCLPPANPTTEEAMFTLWSDLFNEFDRALLGNSLVSLRRAATGRDTCGRYESGWGRVNLLDQGDELVFVAELPGVKESDIEATVHHDLLTVRAERRLDRPENLRLHRQERGSYRFQHSISLPVPVDNERTKANLKDGVLTITMAKAPEHKPRQITVQAG